MLLALTLLAYVQVAQLSTSSSSARLLPQEQPVPAQPQLLKAWVPLVVAGGLVVVGGGVLLAAVVGLRLSGFELASVLVAGGFFGAVAVLVCVTVAVVLAVINGARVARAAKAATQVSFAPERWAPTPLMHVLRF